MQSFPLILCFYFMFVWAANGSDYLKKELIQKGAELCCSDENRDCCIDKMINDEIVTCNENSLESKKSAICLEKFFYNHSIIEEDGYQCCFLLNTKSCRTKCNDKLKKSTLPFHEKFTFTDDCPVPSAKEVEKMPKHKYSCLENANYTLQWCFGECLAWHRQRALNYTINELNNHKTENEEYNPQLHCEQFKEFVRADPCIRVLGTK